jgi:hypothetical protein
MLTAAMDCWRRRAPCVAAGQDTPGRIGRARRKGCGMARGRSERSSAEDPAAWGSWPSGGWSGPPKQCGLPVPKDARRSPPLPEAVSPRAGPPTGLRGPSWGQARALSCGMPQRPRGGPRGAGREAQEQASHPEQGNAHPEGTARGRPRRPGEKPVVKDAPAVAPWGRWPYPDRARHPRPSGSTVEERMRLRLGRVCLLGGLVGARQPGQGR